MPPSIADLPRRRRVFPSRSRDEPFAHAVCHDRHPNDSCCCCCCCIVTTNPTQGAAAGADGEGAADADAEGGLPAYMGLNGAALENLEILENAEGGSAGRRLGATTRNNIFVRAQRIMSHHL